MFCRQCGAQIPEQSDFCPECGYSIRKPAQKTDFGQNNIFTGIAREKTRGSYLEFAIWVAVCLSAVLALMAFVLVDNSNGRVNSRVFVNFQLLWFLVFVFAAGLAVIMALRLRVLTIYAGSIAFFLLLFIPYASCESKIATKSGFYLGSTATPALMKGVVVCVALVAIALVAVFSVQVFTRYHLEKAVFILSICAMGFMMLLGIVSYTAPYKEIQENIEQEYNSYYGDIEEEDRISLGKYLEPYKESYQEKYAAVRNGFGTIAYFLACMAVTLYNVFFFLGWIDNRKRKFIQAFEELQAAAPREPKQTTDQMQQMQQNSTVQKSTDMAELPILRGIKGMYDGQLFPAEQELIIGSQPRFAHIIIQDDAISPQHCCVRYDSANNCFEVKDTSERGTYFSNGQRLQRGIYVSCPRGTVIYLGGERQQFLLQ